MLLDAQTMSVQEVTLPIFLREIVWSPDGDKIALIAEDSSVWQIDYPKLENIEQLTSAMPGLVPVQPGGRVPRVQNVTWSPDGTALAFISDTDIYIVDTSVSP